VFIEWENPPRIHLINYVCIIRNEGNVTTLLSRESYKIESDMLTFCFILHTPTLSMN
jgi:hypothetical protein